MAIGATTIAIPYTYAFNNSGRKGLITGIAVFYISGWVALIFATEVLHLYIGRFLLGCAVGPTYGVIPAYLAEVVSKNVRGANVAFLVISQSVGALIEYGVGPIVSFQALGIISLIFPVLLLIFSILLPETPYYLLSVNKKEEAEEILMKLRGAKLREEIREEFDSMTKCLEESPPMSYKDLLHELSLSKTQKVMVIIAVATFAQQFSGVGAIIVYMETIFKQMKSPILPKNAVMMTECLADATVLMTLLVIDKVGRKPLLMAASLVCVTANLIIGCYFHLREDDLIPDSHTWIGMMGVFLIQIGYGMGLGSVPIIVMSEIMSFSAKGWISGFYLIAQGTYNAVSIKVFQIIGDSIGIYHAYFLFASAILISVGFLMVYMPETRGKSLQEIQHILSKDDHDFDTKKRTNQVELGSIPDLNKTYKY